MEHVKGNFSNKRYFYIKDSLYKKNNYLDISSGYYM